ncbi:MAG TPA: tetratricopeptide repeat protein, partial [Candidatus Limnocylindrales bacterium]|nr:tetratricopeptide repeat protein [Candidatus Limnocylindrales bacterium]
IPAARKQFESVLASFPNHQRSLIMLGQIQVDAGEDKDASLTLQKAVEAGTTNWQAHNLLAIAYARIGELEKSRIECQRTAELNKNKKPAMDLLQAKLFLMEGRNQKAKEALEAFIRNYPNDSGSVEAKKYVARIDEMGKAAIKTVNDSSPEPPHSLAVTPEAAPANPAAFDRPWAPSEVDAAVPPIAPGVSCSSDEVLQKTQGRVLRQLSDLEKFGATEHVEHQFIDTYGVPEAPHFQDFDYLIFVHHTKELPYYFDEYRNGAESLYSFPSALATRGLVSLGFMVIHPVFSQDFQFTCEGLGTWKGQPAWQLHFAQRSDVPSRIRSWSLHKIIYPVPLKGRIWIGANSYNILHLETGLREPVPDLRLFREQLIVDYGPVRFESAKVELWLPWHAEMYFDMQGRRYHHRHTLTNYVLFAVDTQNKIAAPSLPPEPKEN